MTNNSETEKKNEQKIKEDLWIQAERRGMVLYGRYSSWVDYKSFNGEDLKEFDDLPDNIKHAWIMSALGKIKKQPKEDAPKEDAPKEEKQDGTKKKISNSSEKSKIKSTHINKSKLLLDDQGNKFVMP